MQTFLPLPSFEQTARVLDYRRLGKQRVEAMQILNILLKKTEKLGWRNHPAVKMWTGYEKSLTVYMNAMIVEWIDRGYKNNMIVPIVDDPEIKPFWFYDDKFHASHRSNLLRKDPIFYGKYGWHETNNLPYVWPVS